MFRTTYVLRPAARRPLQFLAACLLAAASALAAGAAPEPDRQVLPLPLDHTIYGFATAGDPATYTVEVPRPGFLLIEAHATSGQPVSPEIRFAGAADRKLSGNLPLPAIRGRHVRWIGSPGTYFVEVAATAAGGFRLDAWMVADDRSKREPMDESDELQGGCAKREPMDESDELQGGCAKREPMDESDELQGGCAKREPMDESDELRGEGRWREIAGHGLVELPLSPGGEIRFHAWCPWTERPGLLDTYTCARRLRLDGSDAVSIRPLSSEDRELVGVTLESAGEIAFARSGVPAAGELDATALVVDSRGRRIAEVTAGEPLWLAAGSYYLAVDSAGAEAVELFAELE